MEKFDRTEYKQPDYVNEMSGPELEKRLRAAVMMLLEIPEKMREIYDGPNYKGEIKSLSNMIEELRTQAMAHVSLLKDDKGKPLYSNDVQRQAAANIMVKEDPIIAPQYNELIIQLRTLEKEQSDKGHQLTYYEDMSKTYRAIIPAMVALYERETLTIKYGEKQCQTN